MRRSNSTKSCLKSQQNPILAEARKLRSDQRKRSSSTLRKHARLSEVRKLRSKAVVADAALKAEQRRHAKNSRQHLYAALAQLKTELNQADPHRAELPTGMYLGHHRALDASVLVADAQGWPTRVKVVGHVCETLNGEPIPVDDTWVRRCGCWEVVATLQEVA